MDAVRRDCKCEFDSEFGGGRTGACPQCGAHINANLARHIMDFHLELGQLWRCPVEWCSVWKGTTQDCMDHLRISHHAMELKTLGRYFPPWTVTRAAWNAALRPGVSIIATDVMLFHQHGVAGWCTAFVYARILSLTCPCPGPVMSRLARFAIQASAMARWAITSDRTPRSEADSHLVRQDHQAPEYAPPARVWLRCSHCHVPCRCPDYCFHSGPDCPCGWVGISGPAEAAPAFFPVVTSFTRAPSVSLALPVVRECPVGDQLFSSWT